MSVAVYQGDVSVPLFDAPYTMPTRFFSGGTATESFNIQTRSDDFIISSSASQAASNRGWGRNPFPNVIPTLKLYRMYPFNYDVLTHIGTTTTDAVEANRDDIVVGFGSRVWFGQNKGKAYSGGISLRNTPPPPTNDDPYKTASAAMVSRGIVCKTWPTLTSVTYNNLIADNNQMSAFAYNFNYPGFGDLNGNYLFAASGYPVIGNLGGGFTGVPAAATYFINYWQDLFKNFAWDSGNQLTNTLSSINLSSDYYILNGTSTAAVYPDFRSTTGINAHSKNYVMFRCGVAPYDHRMMIISSSLVSPTTVTIAEDFSFDSPAYEAQFKNVNPLFVPIKVMPGVGFLFSYLDTALPAGMTRFVVVSKDGQRWWTVRLKAYGQRAMQILAKNNNVGMTYSDGVFYMYANTTDVVSTYLAHSYGSNISFDPKFARVYFPPFNFPCNNLCVSPY